MTDEHHMDRMSVVSTVITKTTDFNYHPHEIIPVTEHVTCVTTKQDRIFVQIHYTVAFESKEPTYNFINVVVVNEDGHPLKEIPGVLGHEFAYFTPNSLYKHCVNTKYYLVLNWRQVRDVDVLKNVFYDLCETHGLTRHRRNHDSFYLIIDSYKNIIKDVQASLQPHEAIAYNFEFFIKDALMLSGIQCSQILLSAYVNSKE